MKEPTPTGLKKPTKPAERPMGDEREPVDRGFSSRIAINSATKAACRVGNISTLMFLTEPDQSVFRCLAKRATVE